MNAIAFVVVSSLPHMEIKKGRGEDIMCTEYRK